MLVMGKVRHSYAANKPPLRPWVLINCSGEILVAHCTCMAGLAETSSHVEALLHWVEAAVRISLNISCTSKENAWMPAPTKHIPSLELTEINFSHPRLSSQCCSTSTVSTTSFCQPSQSEIGNFFQSISLEQQNKPIILSLIPPYNDSFACSSDHLPPALLQSLYNPAYLVYDYSQLVELAEEQFSSADVSPVMVNHLVELTLRQSNSASWFRYRAGRVTASRFRQVLHTDPHKPSLSLLKSICYPEVNRFSTRATKWGCKHEKDALLAYKKQSLKLHQEMSVTPTGFHIHPKHPFLGATPDALVNCKCCGSGTVEVKCPLCAEQSSFEDAVTNGTFCLEKQADGVYYLKKNTLITTSASYKCMFVTGFMYCDFVVWSSDELHIERITVDKQLIQTALPVAEGFVKLCVLPELLGKWYTRTQPRRDLAPLLTEEDKGNWCSCKECKGGEMVACDNKSCLTVWFHLECVGLTDVPRGKWYCPTCKCAKKKTSK